MCEYLFWILSLSSLYSQPSSNKHYQDQPSHPTPSLSLFSSLTITTRPSTDKGITLVHLPSFLLHHSIQSVSEQIACLFSCWLFQFLFFTIPCHIHLFPAESLFFLSHAPPSFVSFYIVFHVWNPDQSILWLQICVDNLVFPVQRVQSRQYLFGDPLDGSAEESSCLFFISDSQRSPPTMLTVGSLRPKSHWAVVGCVQDRLDEIHLTDASSLISSNARSVSRWADLTFCSRGG